MELQIIGIIIIIIIIISLYEITKYIKNKNVIISSSNTHLITISDMEWSKSKININIGDKVVWKNLTDLRIQIAINDDSIANSNLLDNYDEHQYTFLKSGEYVFYTPLYKKLGRFTVIVS